MLWYTVAGPRRFSPLSILDWRKVPAMKTLTTIAASTLAMLMLATAAYSQSFLRADHKMSGNRMRSNQRHGRAQAQTLYHAAQAPRPVPRDDTRELVAAIRKDVEASNKALA